MFIVAVDLGTYSVKFLVSKIDRKKVIHQSIREVIIDLDASDQDWEFPLWETQFKIIREFLDEFKHEHRLVINTPREIYTERFTSVPINNRKKAQLMIPFSLEDELPYSISEAHMSMVLYPQKTSTQALVNVAKKEDFNPFYQIMLKNNIKPKLLTSEVSLFENYLSNTSIPYTNSLCILDIGHESTKAYFFYNRKLVSTHTSFVAGNSITESIAQSYSKSYDQAKIYKHRSSFFLTQGQLDQVEEDQRVFAHIMHKTITPLVSEIKRWELGFRIKNGFAVNEFFITGGSSNIKNISNYLAEELNSKVSYLNTFENVNVENIESDKKQQRKFAISNLEVISYPNKSKLINFLNGDYQIPGEMDLPLHSFFFLGTRVAAVTFLIILSLFIDGHFISSDIKSADNIIKSLVKNNSLQLTDRQKRIATTAPKELHRSLKSKTKIIKQEVNTLQSALEVNAFNSLVKVKNVIQNNDVEIIDFNGTSSGEFSAIIKGKSPEILKKVQDDLSRSNFNDLFIDLNEKNLTLTINAAI